MRIIVGSSLPPGLSPLRGIVVACGTGGGTRVGGRGGGRGSGSSEDNDLDNEFDMVRMIVGSSLLGLLLPPLQGLSSSLLPSGLLLQVEQGEQHEGQQEAEGDVEDSRHY
jgi:hypothetical protein